MTMSRALAFLALLFLLAWPYAKADAFPAPAGAPAAAERALLPVSGGRCPRLCRDWFDGCTICSCSHGRIDVCTPAPCERRGRPRCLRWGF
jgi:hypothetical protein